jgi:hypothetical protein
LKISDLSAASSVENSHIRGVAPSGPGCEAGSARAIFDSSSASSGLNRFGTILRQPPLGQLENAWRARREREHTEMRERGREREREGQTEPRGDAQEAVLVEAGDFFVRRGPERSGGGLGGERHRDTLRCWRESATAARRRVGLI